MLSRLSDCGKGLRRFRAGRDGTVVGTLAALVLFRVGIALAVFASSPGRLLPGFPRYRYNPLEGDAYGYYYAARALVATWRRDAAVLLLVTILVLLVATVSYRMSRRGAVRLQVAVWGLGAVAAALAALVPFSGAAQIGWPLLWSVPLLPVRAVTSALHPGTAYAFGLALSLVCNATTVVGTFLLACAAGLRQRIALFAAALFAAWPVLSLLAGPSAARNGTWQIDLGLSLYTEPLSTALVVIGLALVLRPHASGASAAAAGALLGLATLVRVSNVLIVACVIVLLAVWRERRRALSTALGAAAWAPAVLLYWPKGYPKLGPPTYPAHPFEVGYVRDAWSHSLLWHPSVLLVLVPLALLGILRASRSASLLLWACVASTAALYSFYVLTPIHPRFLFVVLPIVLVFWAGGAEVAVRQLGRARRA